MWNHWVVRANSPHQPFANFECSQRTWLGLTTTFPDLIAAVLMPNHLHMILPHTREFTPTCHRLGGIISNISKNNKIPAYWQPIPMPSLIPDVHHLWRNLRYLALNPPRKKLCDDPLEWWWSTHRDVMGATINPVVRPEHIASILGVNPRSFPVRFHSYVSGDPSVQIQGTLPAVCKNTDELKYKSLWQILSAASAALRVSQESVKNKGSPLRPLFAHLAYDLGWKGQRRAIAEICEMSPHGVQWILNQSPPMGMQEARLCLSDPRLTFLWIPKPSTGGAIYI